MSARIVIGGTHSGCGKTSVTMALMRALTRREIRVSPYKVGPDYIDPGFHRVACSRASHNLDVYLMEQKHVHLLLSEAEDIAVIEGVMGYYDGIGSTVSGSTHEMAGIAKAKALLVIDAAGSAASVAAVALGFIKMVPESHIAGVILNHIASERHFELVRNALLEYTGLPAIGYLAKIDGGGLKSRHLGLIPAEELPDIGAHIDRLADALHIDWAAFDAIAGVAEDLPSFEWPVIPNVEGFRLGVARDRAFGFYYEANLMLFAKSGAELVFFSPLHDAALPIGLDGLYIGGGFPEVFAPKLNANASMRASVLSALEAGLHCYAECGGLMYLTRTIDGHEMVGFLDAECQMTDRLQRFGYCGVRMGETRFPAHEFHRSKILDESRLESAIRASKSGTDWVCGYRCGNTLAQYPHIHFLSRPQLAAEIWRTT